MAPAIGRTKGFRSGGRPSRPSIAWNNSEIPSRLSRRGCYDSLSPGTAQVFRFFKESRAMDKLETGLWV